MACVEERSKKGKMGEGRETTDTKTTGAGVHLPAPFTVVFPVSALFFLDFPATSALFLLGSIKRCCLISPNLISSPSLPLRIPTSTVPFLFPPPVSLPCILPGLPHPPPPTPRSPRPLPHQSGKENSTMEIRWVNIYIRQLISIDVHVTGY